MTEVTFAWTDEAVRTALSLEGPSDPTLSYTGVLTDSRVIHGGELFIALVGERFDGHDFVASALEAGCRGAVVSRAVTAPEGTVLYRVPDTLVALGDLARHRRLALPARVVGVTGSVGKTTTKELLAAALGSGLRVHATRGNLNNRIGLPLTLLAAPTDAEVVVAEMGTNEPGEIACLAAIARSDVAVVTTVGESHLEKLGSVEGVLEEKLDLVRSLGEDGVAVVGDEPTVLARRARELASRTRVAGWGEEADPDLRPEGVEVDDAGRHSFHWRGEPVRLAIPGRHVVTDSLLALAVAGELGVRPASAARALAEVAASGMRGEVRALGGLVLLIDCYNANPQSVRAALDLLAGYGGADRRIAVLGSMLELGPQSERLHREVLSDALGLGLDQIVATGDFASAAEAADLRGRQDLVIDADPLDAYETLKGSLGGREAVLLKASRGVALERLVPLFERDFGEAA